MAISNINDQRRCCTCRHGIVRVAKLQGRRRSGLHLDSQEGNRLDTVIETAHFQRLIAKLHGI